MKSPWVILHSLTSIDGQMTGFPPDVGLYYQLAAELPHQAVLSSAPTMMDGAAQAGVDLAVEDEAEPVPHKEDSLPLLAIVDGKGQLARFGWLRQQPMWRDVLILCHQSTPADYLARLRRHHVDHLILGQDRVDLRAALDQLASAHGVRELRVDAGPTLNNVLLEAGLIDEVSLVMAPYLRHKMALRSVTQLQNDHLWLRYTAAQDTESR